FIGDVCLTLPALEAVRAACPAARVAYVVERPAAPLLTDDPRVDEVIVAEPRGGPGADLALAARLRRFAPDVALDFYCNPRTALWTFASGASARVAFALRTGGPDDAGRVAGVIERLDHRGARAVVGWPLARFVALQARCRAFVCGDTGPLHTSVAAGTPTLGLMSRNRPAMFFPYAESDGHRAYYARVECSPC